MIWLVNYFIYMNNIISLYFYPKPKFFYTKNKKFNDSDIQKTNSPPGTEFKNGVFVLLS